MKNIKLMNKIAAVGTDRLDRAKYNVGEDVANPDAIMVRSAALHDLEFNPELIAIARCGAGVNNIPIERCSEAGIVVFNTPGANANGVKELAVCALMLAARDIVERMDVPNPVYLPGPTFLPSLVVLVHTKTFPEVCPVSLTSFPLYSGCHLRRMLRLMECRKLEMRWQSC